jgi:hypothetical protein
MKTLIQALVLVSLGFVLTGCVIVSEEDTPVVTRPPSPEAATLAEIDAAGKLSFDNSRGDALKSIARRPTLSPNAQVYLVETVFRRLSFENSRMSVFKTLIENEAFSNAAKQRLLGNISKLSFDSDRAALLRMISERGELKA